MQKKLFLMSCLLIQGSLLFAASNSKDGDSKKNIKSKVEAAAPASAAAAAASATSAQVKTNSANMIKPGIPLTILSAEEAQKLGFDVPIAVETAFSLESTVPEGYRNFGCTEFCFHQHFCKKTAPKQAHENPIRSMGYLRLIAENQCEKPVWNLIAQLFKNKEKIPQHFAMKPDDPCLYITGPNNLQDKFCVDIDLLDISIPHRTESPTPYGYESHYSFDSINPCGICRVRGMDHKHLRKSDD